MPRIAVLPILAAAVATIAVGSYSTLAGPGPVVDFLPSVSGSSQEAGQDLGGRRSTSAQEGGEGEDGEGAAKVARAIAEEFGVPEEGVLAGRDEGIGFGALFKLYKLARAQGISVDELLATIPIDGNGEREFRFGELRKALTEEQLGLYESGPKNLGKLISAASKKTHESNDEGEEQPGSSRGSGRVPPGQAKKQR